MSTVATGIRLTDFIRDIPNFPKPGILFRDITPLLAAPAAFRAAVQQLADHYRGQKVDVVAAAEARGFIFAAPLALELNVGFVPVRKPGKLPFDTHAFHYELEYGSDSLEIHIDGVSKGQNVLLVRRPLGDRRHDAGLLPSGRAGGGQSGWLRVRDRAAGAEGGGEASAA